MKEELVKFIQNNKDMIELGDFSSLYALCPQGIRSDLTNMLYTAKIYPLYEMGVIPSFFMGEGCPVRVHIPSRIQVISEFAFDTAEMLFVDIEDGLKKIKTGAFYGCKNLKAINIPESVKDIGDSAFAGCKTLSSIKLSSSMTTISSSTFLDCPSLTNVIIPTSITYLSTKIFNRCSELKYLTYEGTKEQWTAIDKAASWSTGSAIKQIRCSDGTVDID